MRLLTVRQIPIRLHSSFLLLAGVMVGWDLLRSGPTAALSALILGTMVFASVLLHELGHALTGRLFGVTTRDITLYPFGGIARMDITNLRAGPEIVISLAGPLVNLVLALLGMVLLQLGLPLAGELVMVNLVLGIFNLVPAFPMDGGRVLRAVISLRRSPAAATRAALSVSRWFAWAFIIAAPLLGSWSLALVGGFLLLSIQAEGVRLARRAALLAAGVDRAAPLAPGWTELAPRDRAGLGFGHPVR
ncbi:MAG: hypothetical protein GXP62_09660 [Oligoflexia bacterium]|nr:hypothetical protein [Oligoflexia bacterium]